MNIKYSWGLRCLFLFSVYMVSAPPLIFSTNVRDFGAVGDGVADDTDAIYAAIQAAEDGEIFFSKGKYRISKSINIELSTYGPLVIKGVSGASTIVMAVPTKVQPYPLQ